mmetsp:Transcript_49269/g.107484  ORF Transcript_49269/g.107484 Transcript_49269/m.107484 type:complete len:382 (+) Transcript_49269:38-1183(+)|eukprot:CAMPEP_0204325442 /NCGR_PEP_ID=MMETSP0469-20131031/11027_1 /ASSEMBLY_ACC=CAM_ASM_000384 /TAXON_ID=2969 /ORGANISM="Oxyrrhis marina" /LENGTH=381 /DNA_ID=CAMNT_0051307299 /DNA_START=29 /DNA_END=1174 /DNA_ORIENTATION=-
MAEAPAEMLACAYHKHGKPLSVVKVQQVARPGLPGEGELLLKVHASSLNPADWKSGEGGQGALLGFQWPRVYGFDFAGVVEAVGSGAQAQEYKTGDEVFGMIRGLPQKDRGTVAEYCCVDAKVCARRPGSVTMQGCASVPLVGITAVKMFRACGLEPRAPGADGPRVLVTGGAGGVGTVAIQLAAQLYGASAVVATASPGEKTDLCARLGATRVVNYREGPFEKTLATEDEGELFDAVIDCTGEAARCVGLIKKGGAMCSILAGPTQEALTTWLEEAEMDPNTITTGVRPFLTSWTGGKIFECVSGSKRLRRNCEARGVKFAHVIGTGNGEIMGLLAGLLKEGKLVPVIDREYPLAEAVEAIEYQKAGRAAGKVIINIVSK